MDENKKPVAERLYFNESAIDGLNVQLETDRTTYARREKAHLNIWVSGKDSTHSPNQSFGDGLKIGNIGTRGSKTQYSILFFAGFRA